MATFTAHEPINPDTLEALLNGDVPAEFSSVPGKFINECDASANTWCGSLFYAMYEVVSLHTPGEDKSENKDYYRFSMESKFPLTVSLKKSGWEQFNCTIRLPQLEGLKAKKTAYTLHFWGKRMGNGRVALDTILLPKLKLEGKYVPSSEEAGEELRDVVKKWYRALEA